MTRLGGALRARRRKINAPLLAAVAATVVCAGMYAGDRAGCWSIPGVDRAELASVDVRFRVRGDRAPRSSDIVIVGLDDATHVRHPEVFQRRRGRAQLVRAIAAHGPRAIGLDMLFVAPEINLPAEVIAKVKAAAHELTHVGDELAPAARQAREALGAVLDAVRGDQLLAEAIRDAGTVVLALYFYAADGDAPRGFTEPAQLAGARFPEAAVVDQPRARSPLAARSAALPLPAIAEGTLATATINVTVDDDGSVRRVPLVWDYGGRYYMPLGLGMARRLLPPGAELSYATGDTSVRFGDRALTVDARARAHLNYLRGFPSFPHISAADVLDGTVAPDALRDKLVFVGRTEEIEDRYPTPLDPLRPGVDIHATLAHNILHGELLHRGSAWSAIAAILILGGLIAALQLRAIRRHSNWIVGGGALLITAGYLVAAQLAFSRGLVLLDVVAPVASGVLVTLASLTAGLATEGRERAQLRAAFSQYVSDQVVERIATNPDLARLGGERRELSVLFSDIRGFSRLSEGLEPEVLSQVLNEYLTPMTEQVMRDGGMLDKYIGDAVMAVYGAPLEQPDHAARACRTALAMQRMMADINARFRARGWPEIAIGIGVNSGAMAVGNMGSAARFDYTVIGDAVNLSARLEALTKDYTTRILVGERTVELVGDAFVFRELDLVRVTGRGATARVFELVGTPGDASLSPAELAAFGEALAAYRAADWATAQDRFASFLRAHPDDGPTRVFLERVSALRARPPGDWDGVYEQRGK